MDKTSEQCPALTEKAKSIEHRFYTLFTLFATCHLKYNGSAPMMDDEITMLGKEAIQIFKEVVLYKW